MTILSRFALFDCRKYRFSGFRRAVLGLVSKNSYGMYGDTDLVQIELTREEALSLFLRCLNSSESDSPEIVSALRKLGHVLEGDEQKLLAS